MKYAFFPGCKIPNYLPQYETSTRAVTGLFGLELLDLEFNCCGYPVRHENFEASILSAARNMAIAAKEGLDILTPCKCCFGNLKHAEYWLNENSSLKEYINTILAQEGLEWREGIESKHLLSVLFHDIGTETLRASIKRPLEGLRIAAHYGCHALRPSNVVRFDNPLAPTIFEELIAVTGASSVEWSRRLECCGNPLWEKNNVLSIGLMDKKLEDAGQAGAVLLCTACTYCQLQFDCVQNTVNETGSVRPRLPSVLYSQLLGLSLGINEKKLGLRYNKIKPGCLDEFLPR